MPSDPDPDQLRIGTSEREEASRVLADHFAEGRLTTDEYDERVAGALAARTVAELRPLFEDLPAPRPSFLAPPAPPFGSAPPNPYAVAARPPAGPPAPVSDRSKVVAGVLQIVLPMGAGRFYTGHIGLALAQLFVTLVTLGVGAIWPIIDGVLLLVNGGVDRDGRRLSG
ncbi:DUF1707 domain-containing protein [Prauserella muralis]|uniref:Uncharacterized protein n=1 Tax=Prauserella muralis TaxID=588067 RepID=A0A2V4AHC9_9PSEU|nr:DUF1707 domain-containing protein [Prauserella muralis]PXY19298.1 hypothetical protein BAY60_31505 [Prauserella muralis]TWE29245.1 TM2 domain-containing protein [Prauserella muralis]